MVIDTSALLAILLDEPERRHFNELVEADETRLVSAAALLEASIVIEARKGEAGGRELDLLLHRAKMDIVPVDAEQVELARVAWRCYGKGRHAAGLNYGDCFSYALAKSSAERLLAKGDDFKQTDIPMCS